MQDTLTNIVSGLQQEKKNNVLQDHTKSVWSVHYIPFRHDFVQSLPGEQEVIQLYINALVICSSATSKQIPQWNELPRSVWRDSAHSRHPRPLQRSISQPSVPDTHRPVMSQTFRVGFTALGGSKDKLFRHRRMEFWVGRHQRHTADSHELL